jgi:hypothetical protein
MVSEWPRDSGAIDGFLQAEFLMLIGIIPLPLFFIAAKFES